MVLLKELKVTSRLLKNYKKERFLLIVPYFVLTLYFQRGALIKGIKAVDDFLMWEIKTTSPFQVKTSFLGVTPPPSLKKRVEVLKKKLVQSNMSSSKKCRKTNHSRYARG